MLYFTHRSDGHWPDMISFFFLSLSENIVIVYSVTINNPLCVLVSYNQKPSILNIGFQMERKNYASLFPWFEAWKLFGSLGYSNIYNIPSGHSRNTGLNSDQILARALFQTCVWVSPQEWLSVYIVNNPCVDSLASRAGGNWIHAMLKPLVGKRGGMVQHPLFSLRVHLFSPLLYFFAYLGLALSTSRLQTRMSLNPSLKSPRLC